ncbi:type II toxin-antitoxin system RelE/ParE family toxin [Rhizobium sp. TRM95796]|uniref:type II toxin-antitoxin system RelE/ParE family toxin n=1 Tax=Rhizobium sp. TRM95796 TaxID=2979862 RepID=UPI0021E922E2|nr:type II toxin-antitoxin system RelE/ParE family toxin [Rhizobium sp. TRM95796]MCV3766327.1 type II toxin-antitoxin system RelE/ParE family toxin [Rhizobium sp. TRM95796]
MTYRIVRHQDVKFDLAAIVDLIGNFAGYQTAYDKIGQIEQALAMLRLHPYIGSPRSEVMPGLRVLPVSRRAVICFTVDDAARIVKIICVAYAGQDWQRLARGREEP